MGRRKCDAGQRIKFVSVEGVVTPVMWCTPKNVGEIAPVLVAEYTTESTEVIVSRCFTLFKISTKLLDEFVALLMVFIRWEVSRCRFSGMEQLIKAECGVDVKETWDGDWVAYSPD